MLEKGVARGRGVLQADALQYTGERIDERDRQGDGEIPPIPFFSVSHGERDEEDRRGERGERG